MTSELGFASKQSLLESIHRGSTDYVLIKFIPHPDSGREKAVEMIILVTVWDDE